MRNDKLEKELERLCREYAACCMEVERGEEAKELKRRVEELCEVVCRGMDIDEPGMLVALMDAYEVTRDEGMLQEVLDVVSANIDRLEVSAEAVKLLAYCYYYVEEEECLVKAKGMLEELRRRGEDVAEAEKVLQNLIIYDL